MEIKWDLFGKYEKVFKTFTLFTALLWVWTVYCTSPEVLQTYVTKMNKCGKISDRHCFTGEKNEVWRAVVPNINDLNSCLHSKVVFSSAQKFNFSAEIEIRHKFLLLNKFNISQMVECYENICEEADLVYIPYIRYSNYSFEIKNTLPVLSDSIEIHIYYVNARYSVYAMLVSICLIWIEAMLLINNSPDEGSHESYICTWFWFSLILFNLGVIFQFLLSFNTLCAYLAGLFKIQFFFVAFVLWAIKLGLTSDSKLMNSFNLFGIILVGWFCWIQLDVYIMINGQENYIEVLRGNWIEGLEIKGKLSLLSNIIKAIFVWLLICTTISAKNSENPNKNLHFYLFLDIFYQLLMVTSAYLKLFFPTAPMNPLYFLFPLLFSIYPYLIQTQEPNYFPRLKSNLSYTPISGSLKFSESKQD